MPFREGELRPYGGAEAEAEGADVPPAHEAVGDEGLVDGGQLVPGVPGLVGDEAVPPVQDLHELGVDPVGVDRPLARREQRPVLIGLLHLC